MKFKKYFNYKIISITIGFLFLFNILLFAAPTSFQKETLRVPLNHLKRVEEALFKIANAGNEFSGEKIKYSGLNTLSDQADILESLVKSGWTIEDPTKVFIEEGVVIDGRNGFLEKNVMLTGHTIIKGDNVSISEGTWVDSVQAGDNVFLKGHFENCTFESASKRSQIYGRLSNCNVGSDVNIGVGSVISNAEIKNNVNIGSFVLMYVKPGEDGKKNMVGEYSIIGDYTVCVWRQDIGARVKIGSYSIIGRTEIGDNTIIGDGCIIGVNDILRGVDYPVTVINPEGKDIKIGDKVLIIGGPLLQQSIDTNSIVIRKTVTEGLENYSVAKFDWPDIVTNAVNKHQEILKERSLLLVKLFKESDFTDFRLVSKDEMRDLKSRGIKIFGNVFINGDFQLEHIESGATILPFTYLGGSKTNIGRSAVIGPFSIIRDSKIGVNSTVSYSNIESSSVSTDAQIGHSYIAETKINSDTYIYGAIIRESVIGEDTWIGDGFVDIDKATIGRFNWINSFSIISRNVRIGNNVRVAPFCFLGQNVTIEDITKMSGKNYVLDNAKIERGGTTGALAVIGRDALLTRGSFIAAASYVTKDDKLLPATSIIRRPGTVSISDSWLYDRFGNLKGDGYREGLERDNKVIQEIAIDFGIDIIDPVIPTLNGIYRVYDEAGRLVDVKIAPFLNKTRLILQILKEEGLLGKVKKVRWVQGNNKKNLFILGDTLYINTSFNDSSPLFISKMARRYSMFHNEFKIQGTVSPLDIILGVSPNSKNIIVFVHGLGGTKDSSIGSVLAGLSDLDSSVVRYTSSRLVEGEAYNEEEMKRAFGRKTFDDEVNDLKLVIDNVIENSQKLFGVIKEDLNIVLIGSSIGGILSVVVAKDYPQVKGLFLVNSGVDFNTGFQMPILQLPRKEIIEESVSNFKGSVLLIRVTQDKVVSLESSERLIKHAKSGRFLSIEGISHSLRGDEASKDIIAGHIISFVENLSSLRQQPITLEGIEVRNVVESSI